MSEDNIWICDFVDPWGSLLLVAVKLHQERCRDTKEIIWCLCVRYHLFNSITRSFIFSIARYTNSIEDFDDSSGPI